MRPNRPPSNLPDLTGIGIREIQLEIDKQLKLPLSCVISHGDKSSSSEVRPSWTTAPTKLTLDRIALDLTFAEELVEEDLYRGIVVKRKMLRAMINAADNMATMVVMFRFTNSPISPLLLV